MLVNYSDASYAIKKAIFERAKQYWPTQLKETNHNLLLTQANQTQKVVEAEF